MNKTGRKREVTEMTSMLPCPRTQSCIGSLIGRPCALDLTYDAVYLASDRHECMILSATISPHADKGDQLTNNRGISDESNIESQRKELRSGVQCSLAQPEALNQ